MAIHCQTFTFSLAENIVRRTYVSWNSVGTLTGQADTILTYIIVVVFETLIIDGLQLLHCNGHMLTYHRCNPGSPCSPGYHVDWCEKISMVVFPVNLLLHVIGNYIFIEFNRLWLFFSENCITLPTDRWSIWCWQKFGKDTGQPLPSCIMHRNQTVFSKCLIVFTQDLVLFPIYNINEQSICCRTY